MVVCTPLCERSYWISNPCHQWNCKVGARLTQKEPSFSSSFQDHSLICGLVPDNKPKAEDQRRGSTEARILCLVPAEDVQV
ncbi:hypothetical protein Pyn_13992 [Prunus yedoensis var. nudiflora]|uniref:Uncharacterized protein n=1 Tax=Prunus yedoensis var. nudiflora TaxID=2094558 RepID=A0A314YGI6_PRUYE|nr:hypothetical protein Pyn_13992 [Prunus yedoensis var. nudiflora]